MDRREKMRINAAAWRAANPDKVKEINRRWYANNAVKKRAYAKLVRAKNPEYAKAAWANWYAKNREYALERVKVYYQQTKDATREKRNAQKKMYRASNREMLNLRDRKWRSAHAEEMNRKKASDRAAHPEKRRKYQQKRRAVKIGAYVGDTAIIARWEKGWRRRSFARCYWCLRRTLVVQCHSDHIVALASGGQHSIENMCISCSKCNLAKHTRSISSWNKSIDQPVLEL